MDDIQPKINVFIDNWSSVLNTILGKDVKIDVSSADAVSKSAVEEKIGSFQAFVSFNYGPDEAKKIVLLLSNKFVSVISNLMIGLDSFSDEISADDKDAFVEAVNQMFSSVQVPIAEGFGINLNFTNVQFVNAGDAGAALLGDQVQMWDLVVAVPEVATENFVLTAPEDFLSDAGAPKESEAPAEAVSAGPAPAASTEAEPVTVTGSNIDLLMDVELPITVRIGTTEMKLVDVMKLGLGSIVELDKLVDDPVEILVNDKLVAKGEVVVFDSNFGVRITEIESKEARIRSLG